MGRPEELDDHNNNREENDAVSDVYTSESNAAIYRTPEEDNLTETDGVFSGQGAPDGVSCDHDPYGQQDHNNSPYTTGSCYGPYGNSGMQNGSPYQNSSKSNHNSPYENRAGRALIHMAIVRIVMVFMEISRIKALVRSRRIYTALMQCRPGRIIPG